MAEKKISCAAVGAVGAAAAKCACNVFSLLLYTVQAVLEHFTLVYRKFWVGVWVETGFRVYTMANTKSYSMHLKCARLIFNFLPIKLAKIKMWTHQSKTNLLTLSRFDLIFDNSLGIDVYSVCKQKIVRIHKQTIVSIGRSCWIHTTERCVSIYSTKFNDQKSDLYAKAIDWKFFLLCIFHCLSKTSGD